jgi:hypothetical protein
MTSSFVVFARIGPGGCGHEVESSIAVAEGSRLVADAADGPAQRLE